MLPHLLPHLVGALTAEDSSWQQKRAALIALCCTTEGLNDSLWACMDDVLPAILTLCTHEHPRVRHGVCHCLGQMCTDFGMRFRQQAGLSQQYVGIRGDHENNLKDCDGVGPMDGNLQHRYIGQILVLVQIECVFAHIKQPQLIGLTKDSSGRVRSHACAALVNFMEHAYQQVRDQCQASVRQASQKPHT